MSKLALGASRAFTRRPKFGTVVGMQIWTFALSRITPSSKSKVFAYRRIVRYLDVWIGTVGTSAVRQGLESGAGRGVVRSWVVGERTNGTEFTSSAEEIGTGSNSVRVVDSFANMSFSTSTY